MRKKILAGTTGLTEPIFVASTASTTGGGLSGLVFGTSGLVCEYRRQGQSSWTTVTLSAGTLGSSSGSATLGTIIADGSLVGAYELAPPDNAFAAGVRWVVVRLYGAANMLPVQIFYELDAVNYQDAVRFGLSAMPNASAAASGGLPTIGATIPNATAGAAGGLFIAGTNAATTVTTSFTTTFTGNLTGSVASVSGNVGGNVVGSVGSISGVTFPANFSVLAIAATTGQVGIDWSNIKAPATTVALTGTTIATSQVVASVSGAVGSVTGNVGGNVVGTVASVVGAVGSVTGNVGGNVTGSVASVVGAVGGNLGGNVVGNVNGNVVGSVGSVLAGVTVSGNVTVGAYAAGQAPLQPTVSGNTLDVSATGGAGIDWANIKSPTTTVGLTGTTISTTQAVASVSGSVGGNLAGDVQGKVLGGGASAFSGVGVEADVQTIKTQTVTAAGGVTFPAATLASTTNITAGTITTVATTTNLTNLPSIPNNWLTAAGIAAGALNGKGDWNTVTPPTVAAIATAIWTDTTSSDFATVGSPGHILVPQVGGTFTTTSSSIFTTAALQNAPTAGGDPWDTVEPGSYPSGTFGYFVTHTLQQLGVAVTLPQPAPAGYGPGGGAGTTIVNQDYGGTDNLTMESSPGVPVQGGFVTAYLQSSYQSDPATAPAISQTTTDANGFWSFSLPQGATYSVVFTRNGGVFNPITDVVPVMV